MIRFISLLISIPLIILIAAFTYKNAQLITIDLFVYQITLPLTVVLLLVLLMGVLLGYLVNLFTLLSQKATIRQLKRKKEALHGLSGVLNKSDK